MAESDWEDVAQKKGGGTAVADEWEDVLAKKSAVAPNIASESEMVAHPPKPTFVSMKPVVPTRLEAGWKSLNQPLSRPAGGGEEHTIAEGSLPAVAGMTTLGTLGMPIEAIATRSLAPLYPLARGYLGSIAGRYAGHDIGGMFGHPEVGSTIGGIAGGLFGAAGGKIVNPKVALLKSILSSAPEAEAAEAQAARGIPSIHTAPSEGVPATPARTPVATMEPPVAVEPQRPVGTAGERPQVQYKPSEKVATMSAPTRDLGPEFTEASWKAEIDRSKKILANEKVIGTQRAAAEDRLRDAQEGLNRVVQGGKSAPITPETAAAKTAPATVPTAEAVAPTTIEAPKVSLSDVVNKATGAKPLSRNVPLREQLTKMTPPEVESPEAAAFKAKYPDKPTRQMAMANGEAIVDAVGNDPDTMKAVHDLTRVDLRQALINSGEDMGQRTVSNSKFAGEGSITREDAFNRLLKKGHSPEEIVRLAKAVPETPFGAIGTIGQRVTLNPEGKLGAREIGGATPEEQFEKSFGPEHKLVKGQAEWDLGPQRPEGIIRQKKSLVRLTR